MARQIGWLQMYSYPLPRAPSAFFSDTFHLDMRSASVALFPEGQRAGPGLTAQGRLHDVGRLRAAILILFPVVSFKTG